MSGFSRTSGRTFRGAIVGFGEVAQFGHLPAYIDSPLFEVVAVVERSAERRALAAGLPSRPRAYETLEQLAAHEQIDFIDVCTPPALHGQPMLAALERGWHVVCEKPFLLEPPLVDRARELASSRGLACVPVHNWKYAPIVLDATRRLRAWAPGELRRVDIHVERLKDFKGADPDRPNWRRDPSIAGGGILLDHGWHAIYLALAWFGHAAPSNVSAQLHYPAAGGLVEDDARVTIEFPDGEAFISLTWQGAKRSNTMRLIGRSQTIDLDDDRLVVDGKEAAKYSALSGGSHHADWFATFIPALAGHFADPAASREAFEEAAACLSIVRRAYGSAKAL